MPASGTSGGIDREERKWAMICHISALIGLLGNGVGFVVAPLIIWLLKREEYPFVDEQGKEIVNFQITMFIVMLICGILSLVVIGIPLMILTGLLMVILPVIGAIKANDGEHFRYPLTIRFIK